MRGLVHNALPLLGVLVLSSSCGGDPAPPPKVQPVASPERIDRGAISVESEIGGLNEEAMDKAFQEMRTEVQACVEERGDVELLGGTVKVSLRIGKDGSARWAYLSESTLGDRDVEKCVLDEARRRAWPPPLGGEGLADKEFSVDAIEPPLVLEAEDIRPAIRHIQRETHDCRKGLAGKFLATAYLHPSGRVLSAGMSPPHENMEEAVDCMVERIEKLRFGKLGRRPAKISFELP